MTIETMRQNASTASRVSGTNHSTPVCLAADHPWRMPAYVSESTLIVRELAGTSSWYQQALGLQVIDAQDHVVSLGVDGLSLLRLEENTAAIKAPEHAPGLFHNAFLLPSRQALANWFRHAAANGVAIDGAANHGVSDAIYLDDPEGNGIEMYRDRPREEWHVNADETVEFPTRALDLQALLDEGEHESFDGLESGTVLGHIHLKVSTLPETDRFFDGLLGFNLMNAMDSAHFHAAGHYHHHVGTNTWRSFEQPPREASMTGLKQYTITFNDASLQATARRRLTDAGFDVTGSDTEWSVVDPWGMQVRIRSAS